MKNYRNALLILVLACSPVLMFAQPAGAPPGGAPSAAGAAAGGIKPYKDVITAQAKSDDGLFTVHRIDEKLFYEIPNKLLGKEMLLVTRQAKTPSVGYGGEETNEEVVRWERKYNRILLRAVSYVNVAADSLPISKAVKNANFEEIIASFPILALAKDSNGVVIDVTSMFTTDIGILTPPKPTRDQFRIGALDANRSFVEYARSFPENVEVENVITYSAEAAPQNTGSRTMSFTMHHSMIKLPDVPMMARQADPRVGWFSLTRTDYGLPTQKAERRTIIRRWRLEPKDEAAYFRGELVEPKKQITYYIDPATPVQWRPALKKGVEAWNVAFEQAGFKNAIRCIEAPTPKEDPEWSPEDARYSVIRYYPSPVKNAYGPNVADPRSGEILESDIGWFHNVMNLIRDWYFVQAVADPRSHKMPLPDSLMSELISFVSAHEVGHTLGFPHNMKASNAYPVDSLRSKTFTQQYGTAPSIMDYARFNYVAQPGDGAAMMPNIGPYDKFATKWGYRLIKDAKTPEDELATTRAWAKEAQSNKMLRFGAQQFAITDPLSQTEDLGDDAIKATGYGVKNLERVMGYLPEAAAKAGESYDELRGLYEEVLGQWNREMGHVANYPGGVDIVLKVNGDEGNQYTALPRERQKAAVQFLSDNAWKAPKFMLREDVIRKIYPNGSVKLLQDAQARLVRTVLSNDKLLRLLEHESMEGAKAYSVRELFVDVENAIFSDVKQAKPQTDDYRRNLQRTLVDELGKKLAPPPPPVVPPGAEAFRALFATPDVSNTDVRGLARMQLEGLKATCSSASGKAADAVTKAHLRDLAVTIENILDPKK
ncbi:MAG: zinc-dependent metalloprotease [Candidatus Kapabacteria bacterium]|nr:zinc-dependent metalloprotease [Candidatus Kapabacteria bacterium]